MNLVERWFSALTTKKLQRSAHRSVKELVAEQPNSRATASIGRPDDRTNATASRLNSGDHRRRESPMMNGLLPRPPSLCQVSAPAGDAQPCPARPGGGGAPG